MGWWVTCAQALGDFSVTTSKAQNLEVRSGASGSTGILEEIVLEKSLESGYSPCEPSQDLYYNTYTRVYNTERVCIVVHSL